MINVSASDNASREKMRESNLETTKKICVENVLKKIY